MAAQRPYHAHHNDAHSASLYSSCHGLDIELVFLPLTSLNSRTLHPISRFILSELLFNMPFSFSKTFQESLVSRIQSHPPDMASSHCPACPLLKLLSPFFLHKLLTPMPWVCLLPTKPHPSPVHLLPLFPFPEGPSLPPFLIPTHHLEPPKLFLWDAALTISPQRKRVVLRIAQSFRFLPFLQDQLCIPETLSHRTHFCLSYHLAFFFLIQISIITFVC